MVRAYPFHVPVNNVVLVEVLQAFSGICKLELGNNELRFRGGIKSQLPDEAGSPGWTE